MAKFSRDDLKEVFDFFDADKSGKIDCAELKNAVNKLFEGQNDALNAEQLNDIVGSIMAEVDTSADGKIDIQEWYKYFEKAE